MGQGTASPMNERDLAIRDIERTREEMGHIVDDLEARLSPAHLKQQMAGLKDEAIEQIQEAKEKLKADMRQEIQTVKNEVREATIGRMEHMVERASDNVRHAGTTVAGSVRDNPIPYAMIGLGVGWLIATSRRRAHERGYARIGDRTEQLDLPLDEAVEGSVDEGAGVGASAFAESGSFEQGERSFSRGGRPLEGSGTFEEGESYVERGRERVGQAFEKAQSSASDITHGARERAEHVARRAKRRASQAREKGLARVRQGEERIGTMARENPLALGAVVFALGAAFGLALPRTRFESRMVGQSRKRVVDRLESATKGALESIQDKAHESMHAQEERQRDVEETPAEGAVDRTADYSDPTRQL